MANNVLDVASHINRVHAITATRVFNLTLHGLGAHGATPAWARLIYENEKCYWVAQQDFDRLLDCVAQWPDVRITFDDGNRSDVTVAMPQLVRRGMRGSFFIVAARVGEKGFLGRSELRELLSAGMEIGSHGMRHQPWRGLRGDDLRQEIHGAKALLEDLLGIPITQAACPFGNYGRHVLGLLAEAGFSRVYTSDRGWAKPEAWLQARNTITAATSLGDLERVRTWSCAKQLAHRCKLVLKRFR